MFDRIEPDWPDDLSCEECGALVGDDGAKIRFAHLVIPREAEYYGWCENHKPQTIEEERELKQAIKRGEYL